MDASQCGPVRPERRPSALPQRAGTRPSAGSSSNGSQAVLAYQHVAAAEQSVLHADAARAAGARAANTLAVVTLMVLVQAPRSARRACVTLAQRRVSAAAVETKTDSRLAFVEQAVRLCWLIKLRGLLLVIIGCS